MDDKELREVIREEIGRALMIFYEELTRGYEYETPKEVITATVLRTEMRVRNDG